MTKQMTFTDTPSDTYGEPLYKNYLQYCTRCCMPSSNEGMQFDELGICLACRAQEQKMRINWKKSEAVLRETLEGYKEKAGDNYDCIIPISGGKDSVFQLHVLKKVYGMKPLAVTFNHNWYSETGKYNLENALEKLEIDHIMFTPNKALVKKLFVKSFYKIGDSCWHCHAGVGAFPLQIAVKFNIPLLIWGESVCESSGRADFRDNVQKFDRDYFTKVSAKLYPEQMIDEEITRKDLKPFELPSFEDIERVGVVGLHLGDYLFWDDERQMEFIKKEYDWREEHRPGHYKGFKGNECKFETLHDHMKYVKRGFGRGTDQASADVRAGLLTREEGFEIAKKYDQQRPAYLDEFLDMANITEEEYNNVLKAMRQGKFRECR